MRIASILMPSILAMLIFGCAPQQPYVLAPQIADPQPSPLSPGLSPTQSPAQPTDTRALPYQGRLVEGDPTELPPAVAKSLSKDARLTFSYREELTHDEYHIPYMVYEFDPTNWVTDAPIGDYAVTAHATLTISLGDRVIADYSAQARVTRSYSLHSEPKHSDVERAAREAVRARIDNKIFADANRVAGSTSSPSPTVPE